MYFDPVIFNNENYKIVLVFLYAVVGTYMAATYFKRKFISHNFFVYDMYKANSPKIANLGGTAALVGILIALVLSQLIVKELSTSELLIFYFIVIIHAVFGLIDDLINTSNIIKIVAPYFMVLPVLLLAKATVLTIGPYNLHMGILFLYVITPIYVLVVTNLINMHSGFNGLASGVSWLIICSLIIRSILHGQIDMLFYIIPIFGSLTVLRFYDKYPAKMIWGNIGSMMYGAAIGTYIVVSEAFVFGILILMPHIFDFILYFMSKHIARKDFLKIKFGKLRKDGTIQAPTPLKLKFLFPYYFKLTEKQTVWIMYGITAFFCILALVLGV